MIAAIADVLTELLVLFWITAIVTFALIVYAWIEVIRDWFKERRKPKDITYQQYKTKANDL